MVSCEEALDEPDVLTAPMAKVSCSTCEAGRDSKAARRPLPGRWRMSAIPTDTPPDDDPNLHASCKCLGTWSSARSGPSQPMSAHPLAWDFPSHFLRRGSLPFLLLINAFLAPFCDTLMREVSERVALSQAFFGCSNELFCATVVLALQTSNVHRAWPRVLKRDSVVHEVPDLALDPSVRRLGVKASTHDVPDVSRKHPDEGGGPHLLGKMIAADGVHSHMPTFRLIGQLTAMIHSCQRHHPHEAHQRRRWTRRAVFLLNASLPLASPTPCTSIKGAPVAAKACSHSPPPTAQSPPPRRRQRQQPAAAAECLRKGHTPPSPSHRPMWSATGDGGDCGTERLQCSAAAAGPIPAPTCARIPRGGGGRAWGHATLNDLSQDGCSHTHTQVKAQSSTG